jgi:hypothetical protein
LIGMTMGGGTLEKADPEHTGVAAEAELAA